MIRILKNESVHIGMSQWRKMRVTPQMGVFQQLLECQVRRNFIV